MPAAADPPLLTDLLRDGWGFTGTVVSDYFGVTFLQTLHGVAGGPADAAGLALAAGIDVELPTVRCYGAPLLAAVRGGRRRPRRWSTGPSAGCCGRSASWACSTRTGRPGPPALEEAPLDLDPPARAGVARRLAEESVVLLANDGALPLAAGARIAVVGPARRRADGHARLLHVPQPRRRPPPRGADRASRSRRCWRRCAPSCPARRRATRRAARCRRRRPTALAEAVARRRRPPTCASWCSATGPACSAAAPPARAATPPTCACPAAGGAAGGAAGHRHAGGAGAAVRPPVRPGRVRRPAGRGRAGVLPRRGGRPRGGRRALRPGRPVRPAAGRRAAPPGRPARRPTSPRRSAGAPR